MAALLARTMIGAVLVLWWRLNSAEADGEGCDPLPDTRPPVFCRDPAAQQSDVAFPDELCPVNSTLQCSSGGTPWDIGGPVCLDNGQWSGSPPECRIPGCQPPEVNFLSRVIFSKEIDALPDNAFNEAQQLSLYPANTEASYQCDPGFILVGNTVRICSEARWSGAAPHCYLNVAERSSLVIIHNELADGNTRTHEFLGNLFHSESDSLSINLYFPTRILQVRLVADNGMEGINMRIALMNGNASVGGSTAMPYASTRYGFSVGPAEFIVFNDTERQTPEADTLSVSLLGLQPPAGVKLYELQIVADSTGLSWRQCLDEVGSEFTPTQRNTWAYGNWCYHLVKRTENQQVAEGQCASLGENGTLYRPVTGLNDMTIDMLSGESFSHYRTRSNKHIWIHGQEANQSNDDQALSGASKSHRCRVLSLDTNEFIYSECENRHPFICQRAPRLCGSFPRKTGLGYTPPERAGHLRGDTINVTCDDPGRTTGQIRCLAPGWSPPDFCNPAPGGYLGAILGGAVGGVIVLAVLTLTVIRGWNSRRERRRQKQFVPPVDEGSEFLGLNANPIYGDSSNDDENLYSEVSNPEAIYEECSYVVPFKRSPSPEPPPLPATRPSVGSLVGAVVPASPDSDYEVFPMETADPQPKPLQSAERSVPYTAAATPALPVQIDPDYEAFPVDPLMLPDGAAGAAPAAPSSSTPAVPGNSRSPTLEYAVPLVGGRPPGGREENSSFAERPTDVPHVSVGEDEDEYALPYRAETNAGSARRSIPDVAMAAMGVGTAGRV